LRKTKFNFWAAFFAGEKGMNIQVSNIVFGVLAGVAGYTVGYTRYSCKNKNPVVTVQDSVISSFSLDKRTCFQRFSSALVSNVNGAHIANWEEENPHTNMPPGFYEAMALVSPSNAILSSIKYTYKGPEKTPGSETQSVNAGVLCTKSYY